jgi:hypothetical protein
VLDFKDDFNGSLGGIDSVNGSGASHRDAPSPLNTAHRYPAGFFVHAVISA